jgi:hypothetical protein
MVGRLVISRGTGSNIGVVCEILGSAPAPRPGHVSYYAHLSPQLCRVRLRNGQIYEESSEYLTDLDLRIAAEEQVLVKRLRSRDKTAADLGALPRDAALDAQDLEQARKLNLGI